MIQSTGHQWPRVSPLHAYSHFLTHLLCTGLILTVQKNENLYNYWGNDWFVSCMCGRVIFIDTQPMALKEEIDLICGHVGVIHNITLQTQDKARVKHSHGQPVVIRVCWQCHRLDAIAM